MWFLPCVHLRQMETHSDNNGLHTRALTWQLKKKKVPNFILSFLHVCLFANRFLQKAVTGLFACTRISPVSEQYTSLKETMVSFSNWSPSLDLPLDLPFFPNTCFMRSLYPCTHLSSLLFMLFTSPLLFNKGILEPK